MAIFFAASYPNRTASLVLDGCFARLARAPDYPWGMPGKVLEQRITRAEDARVGGDAIEVGGLRYLAPHALHDAEFLAQYRRYHRLTIRPAAVRADAEMLVYADLRPLLSAIQAPTLVFCRSGDQFVGKPHAAYFG